MKSKTIVLILSYELIKVTLVFLFFGTILSFVSAHQQFFPTPVGPDDHISIVDPNSYKAYYGELDGFPHTYKLSISEPTVFSAKLMVPEAVTDKDRFAILVREERRGVSEVARLNPKDATWNTYFEAFTGETYRIGPNFEANLEPGNYLFEVSMPSNQGKYILLTGQEEDLANISLTTVFQDVYQVKVFMDKPFFMVLQSPFYYVPAISILLAVLIFLYHFRKHKHIYYA